MIMIAIGVAILRGVFVGSPDRHASNDRNAGCRTLNQKGRPVMDNRVKELIAIGASITANCQPCLEYHVAKARENGAEEAEIKAAIAVGKTVRKGAAGKMDQYVSKTFKDSTAAPDAAEKVDGCRLT